MAARIGRIPTRTGPPRRGPIECEWKHADVVPSLRGTKVPDLSLIAARARLTTGDPLMEGEESAEHRGENERKDREASGVPVHWNGTSRRPHCSCSPRSSALSAPPRSVGLSP